MPSPKDVATRADLKRLKDQITTPEAERTVHAQSYSGSVVLVRYATQGRWYVEFSTGDPQPRRIKTVHEAASKAVEWESAGGEIFTGRPGGKQFDSKVAGCRQKAGKQ